PHLGPHTHIAAHNTPTSTVISGDTQPVNEIVDFWRIWGVRTSVLQVSRAFHSHHIDAIAEELGKAARALEYHPPRIPVVSNVTGELGEPELMTSPQYWVDQARQPVRFYDGVRTLRREGTAIFLEVGPDTVLAPLAYGCLEGDDDTGAPAAFAATLRGDRDELPALLAAVGQVHVGGGTVDWQAVLDAVGVARPDRPVELPTYAFQGRHYWLHPGEQEAGGGEAGGGEDAGFWDAVESGDLASVAAALDLDDEQRQAMRDVLSPLSVWRRRRRCQYRIRWTPLPEALSPGLSGTWLVPVPADLADAPSVAGVVGMLGEAGATARLVPVEAGDTDTFSHLLRGASLDTAVAGVLSLLALDREIQPGTSAVPAGLALTVALVGALEEAGLDAPVWIATRGAVRADGSDPGPDPLQALVWGYGQVAADERTSGPVGLVDLPEHLDDAARARLGLVLAGGAADQVAVRGPVAYAARLARAPLGGQPPEGNPVPPGPVVFTGAGTALAARTARWLAGDGAERVVFTGPAAAQAAGARGLLTELAALGVHAEIAESGAELSGERVAAVVHVADLDAGHAGPAGIAALDREIAAVQEAAATLSGFADAAEPPMFLFVTSAAGALGGAGLGDQAPGHAYLDAFAARLQAAGHTVASIAVGPTDDTGDPELSAAPETAAQCLREWGMRALPPGQAVAALRQAAGGGFPLLVADIDWERALSRRDGAPPRRLFHEIPEVRRIAGPAGDGGAAAGRAAGLRRRLAGAPEAERERLLLDLVHRRAATVLGFRAAEEVKPDDNLLDLGLSSFTALELSTRLAEATGLQISPVAVFENATPSAMARFLNGEFAAQDGPAPEPGDPPDSPPPDSPPPGFPPPPDFPAAHASPTNEVS
ncbi:acyltransferase domain-containing protein, partial [Actinomadura sp. 6K520]|uniref:acyltransferase domain-containing protein n=1 Tax=Actinomadura sp. 6K520 TaxID=2530364 RepID=UPI001051FEFE